MSFSTIEQWAGSALNPENSRIRMLPIHGFQDGGIGAQLRGWAANQEDGRAWDDALELLGADEAGRKAILSGLSHRTAEARMIGACEQVGAKTIHQALGVAIHHGLVENLPQKPHIDLSNTGTEEARVIREFLKHHILGKTPIRENNIPASFRATLERGFGSHAKLPTMIRVAYAEGVFAKAPGVEWHRFGFRPVARATSDTALSVAGTDRLTVDRARGAMFKGASGKIPFDPASRNPDIWGEPLEILALTGLGCSGDQIGNIYGKSANNIHGSLVSTRQRMRVRSNTVAITALFNCRTFFPFIPGRTGVEDQG